MTITFRVAPETAEQVGFTYSPLLEAVLSLHVLVEPKHHPLQHQWARGLRRLPAELRREITAMAFAYREYFPAFCFPAAEGRQQSFAEEIARLRALPGPAVQEEFAVALFGEAARQGARAPQDGQPAAAGPEIGAAVADRPEVIVARFADLLAAYWDCVFAEEWERLEQALAGTVRDVGEELAASGLYHVLRRLFPEVRSSAAAGCFWLERPHSHDLTLAGNDRLTLVPSYYVHPHVRANCDQPWPLTIVLPAAFLARRADVSLAPQELTDALRAVAESTRLRILRLIAAQPRSTEELAPLLHLSPAALSKHLRQLAAAGLVTTSRDGYYVLYALHHERCAAITPAMEAFIYGHRESGLPEGRAGHGPGSFTPARSSGAPPAAASDWSRFTSARSNCSVTVRPVSRLTGHGCMPHAPREGERPARLRARPPRRRLRRRPREPSRRPAHGPRASRWR